MADIAIKIIPFEVFNSDIKRVMKGTTVTNANPKEAIWFGAFPRNQAKLIGCGCLVPKGESGRLKSLAVLPEHRGQGVGSLLVRCRIDYSRKRTQVKKLTTFSSSDSRSILLKEGFKLVRRIPRKGRETWFMELSLSKVN